MMDGNKDEANRCIEIGLTALRLGNVDKAKKMFEKAHRLFPSKRAEDLLEARNWCPLGYTKWFLVARSI